MKTKELKVNMSIGSTPIFIKNKDFKEPKDALCYYLISSTGCYIVKNKVRQMVEFSYFNLLSSRNSLLSNVDCIFCCNALIYMQKQLQGRVLDLLYKSLAVPGYLILGEAETLTENLYDKLECLDARAKIYKRRE